jgi:hypothetical protein
MGGVGGTGAAAGSSGKGGSGGAGGSGGVGGSTTPAHADKIDLLFAIDNSSSMADKQKILAAVAPEIVAPLVSPPCVDSQTGAQVAPSAPCPAGSAQEFPPVTDIHVGIISSSLGGHGANVCLASETARQNVDMAHLLTRGATSAPAGGFLAWDGGTTTTELALVTTLQSMIAGVGETGCGYEAPLESVYRFLVDPDPYDVITIDASHNAILTGTDQVVLTQRADFLRPDSLVAIVTIGDENDCSIWEGGQNWVVLEPPAGGFGLLKAGTQQCASNPNDPCCQSCQQPQRVGCPDMMADPNCQQGYLAAGADPQNMRCFHQKQKYGYEFFYPVERYIDAAVGKDVPNRAGELVPNPLFSDLSAACKTQNTCKPPRNPGLVFWAGIHGVPWQDIARDPADLTKGLKSGAELASTGVWPIIVGDPTAIPPIPPADPLMIESVAPRSATKTGNPLGTAALPAPPNSGPAANPINGHEWEPAFDAPPNADLQYACIFPLATSRQCTPQYTACDCNGTPGTRFNPLCQDVNTGQYSTVQARAKAYPSIRQLQVIQGLGDQGIVASICPKTLDPTNANDGDYGYRPAARAMVEGFRRALR